MKKFLSCLIVLILLLLNGCRPVDTSLQVESQSYVTAVWLSYNELDAILKTDFKSEFKKLISNCKEREITDIFVHTVPFCDSYYSSKILPLRASAKEVQFDVLDYMINECHQSNIKFHAWINPYRVRTADSDVSALPEESPAKKWQNTKNVSTVSGVYLNPASSEVRGLILEVIREIISAYKVDGIHFDDYFYPTTDESFDSASYAEYCNATSTPLPLDDFRRANVNALISGAYTAIKFTDKNVIFSVSPSASIEENYTKHYADVAAWCQNNCLDYIIPQLYFGFEYPDANYRFDSLLSDWKELTSQTTAKLIIGLAAYKINTTAEPDCAEWQNGKEIIKKQTEICKKDPQIAGHSYFSYSYVVEKV